MDETILRDCSGKPHKYLVKEGMEMDRKAIRSLLATYLEAKRQQDAILEDQDVQGLFAQEKESEARELIAVRYPNGDFRAVNKAALELIHTMVDGIPAWSEIDPMDVYTDHKAFDEFLALAKQV